MVVVFDIVVVDVVAVIVIVVFHSLVRLAFTFPLNVADKYSSPVVVVVVVVVPGVITDQALAGVVTSFVSRSEWDGIFGYALDGVTRSSSLTPNKL